MIDVYLLRIMRNKSDYLKLISAVPPSIDAKTRAILSDYGKYFDLFTDQTKVDMNLFLPQFKLWHTGLTDEQFLMYKGVLINAAKPVSEDIRAGIANQLNELQLGTTLANIAARFDDGDVEDIFGKVDAAQERFKLNRGANEVQFLDMEDIEYFYDDLTVTGLNYRLSCLRECMRPLIPGDFGIWAGRPGTGKTALAISEVTHMAPQLDDDQIVLWLNNESTKEKLGPRLYQAALGMDLTTLKKNRREDNIAAYRKHMGFTGRIKVVDCHGWNIGQVVRLMDDYNVGIVVFDMIDHLTGFGTEARTDLALEEMYKWGRELCVRFKCTGIALCQSSDPAEGMLFPPKNMLKDSRTGKQGACDYMIMVGMSPDINLAGQRFISIPKTKLNMDGCPADPRATVNFNGDMSRYDDVPIGE